MSLFQGEDVIQVPLLSQLIQIHVPVVCTPEAVRDSELGAWMKRVQWQLTDNDHQSVDWAIAGVLMAHVHQRAARMLHRAALGEGQLPADVQWLQEQMNENIRFQFGVPMGDRRWVEIERWTGGEPLQPTQLTFYQGGVDRFYHATANILQDLAAVVVGHKTVSLCEACHQPFLVQRAKQRYCSSRCQARIWARERRHKQKDPEQEGVGFT